MKHLSFCISFLLLLALAACNDDKHPEEEPWWYPNHFEGDLNNKSVSLNETTPGIRIGTAYAEHFVEYEDGNYILLDSPKKLYGIHIPLMGIITVPSSENKEIYLEIDLCPLREGTYTIQCDGPIYGSSLVCITSEELINPQVEYFPSKEPLKLEITRIEYLNSSGIPIVEGWLEGVLYRKGNPQDFIMIKNATFSTH